MRRSKNSFDEAIKKPVRNRGYIKVDIGIINKEAQNNAEVIDTQLEYYSTPRYAFSGETPKKIYATCENNFSTLDGNMYFVPKEGSELPFYNNGIVTKKMMGSVIMDFGDITNINIKGFTIDFGDCYPTEFEISTSSKSRAYENNSRYFTVDESFDNTTYVAIIPVSMVNGESKLRIYQLKFGVANTFLNNKMITWSSTESISPVSETIPSRDVSFSVDNHDLYYSADNPESAMSYMETGMEVHVSHGYDVTGNGDIEWIEDTRTFLKTWKATDKQADFTSTDRFCLMDGDYYGGKLNEEGTSLYDLAVDVLKDAGITDENEYEIDYQLKDVLTYNPMPVVSHAEALQIIANAGRCILYEDKDNKIRLKTTFTPNVGIESNGETLYSDTVSLLNSLQKYIYATQSEDFSKLDGSMYFLTSESDEYFDNTGYASDLVADKDGEFDGFPRLTLKLESSTTRHGIKIKFVSTYPKELSIITYKNEKAKQSYTFENDSLEFSVDEKFEEFDTMNITFDKGHPNSRVFVESVTLGEFTDYTIKRNDMYGSPVAERQEKVKSISVAKHSYKKLSEEIKELVTEEVVVADLPKSGEYIIYLSKPSYGYEVKDEPHTMLSPNIIILDSSDYYVKLKIEPKESKRTFKLILSGYEYETSDSLYKKTRERSGIDINWDNPLISTDEQAKALEEWLASYYLGEVDYDISWRGDPRVDANDLFYLELKNGDTPLIQAYENTLEFNGAWSGTISARRIIK